MMNLMQCTFNSLYYDKGRIPQTKQRKADDDSANQTGTDRDEEIIH